MIDIIEFEAIRFLLGEVKRWDRATTANNLALLDPRAVWYQVGQFWVATNATPPVTLQQVQAGLVVFRARQQRPRIIVQGAIEHLVGRNVVYEVAAQLSESVFVVVQWRVVEREFIE